MACLSPLLAAAARSPDHPALIWRGESLSYAWLGAQVRGAVRFLREQGVSEGDVVALWADPCPAWAAIAHAAGLVGAILLPLNLRLTIPELEAQLARARPSCILVDAARASLPLSWPQVALEAALDMEPCSEPLLGPDPARRHAILFTSGTTGSPKAALLNWGQHQASAEAACAVLGLRAEDRWLLNMPLFHVGGLNILYRCAQVGATAILHDRFDLETAREAIACHGATMLSLVPAMLRRLLEAFAPEPLPASVRAVMLGGAAIPPDLLLRCPQALASYGLTETCSHVTLVRPGAQATERASSGRAIPGTQLQVVRENGERVPPGIPGQLEVRGPTVFAGYLADPEATAAAFRGSWLRTGDDGVLDADGNLTVLSRRTDLIVSGGENIYPAEIETLLETHPAVREAAVVAVPDDRWGAVPGALITWRELPLTWQELETYLASHLARYKRPRYWLELEALPRLANGKLDRRAAGAFFATLRKP